MKTASLSSVATLPYPASFAALLQKKMRTVFMVALLGSVSLPAMALQAMAQNTNYHGATPLDSEATSTQKEMKKGKGGSATNGFGRMFSLKRPGATKAGLAPQNSPVYDLRQLGNSMKEPKAWETHPNRSGILPSGYVFLGQFIDHDITLDTISHLDQPLREGMLENQRTVALDLDNVYGGGPERSSHLYNLPWLRIGQKIKGVRSALPRHDLLRSSTGTGSGAQGGGGTALIGDFRNDENFVVSQLQMAFIAFHNRIVNQLIERDYGSRRAEFCGSTSACKSVESLVASAKFPGSAKREIFEKARDHVIHYYHRVISEDFLPRLIGAKRASDILSNGRNFYFPKGFVHSSGKLEQPFIPLEFAGAAYRYGHAQVRQTYRNRAGKNGELPLFRAGGGHGRGSRVAGFNAIRSDRIIDWQFYFPLSKRTPTGFNFANKLTPFLPAHLHNLGRVGVTGNDVVSLAARNLNRGRIYRLPSGQDIARKILPSLQSRGILKSWTAANSSQRQSSKLSWQNFVQKPDAMTTSVLGNVKTPLWYYVLQEAAAFNVAGSQKIVSQSGIGGLQGLKGGATSESWESLVGFGLPDNFYSMKSVTLSTGVSSGGRRPGTVLGNHNIDQFNSILNGANSSHGNIGLSPLPNRKQPQQGISRNVVDLRTVGGHTLGPVGGTIVGEVLFGLLEHYREQTGKGLDYTPALQPKANTNNTLDRSSAAAQGFYNKPLTATSGLGIRYQMRNLIYDAGVGFPVTVSR